MVHFRDSNLVVPQKIPQISSSIKKIPILNAGIHSIYNGLGSPVEEKLPEIQKQSAGGNEFGDKETYMNTTLKSQMLQSNKKLPINFKD